MGVSGKEQGREDVTGDVQRRLRGVATAQRLALALDNHSGLQNGARVSARARGEESICIQCGTRGCGKVHANASEHVH